MFPVLPNLVPESVAVIAVTTSLEVSVVKVIVARPDASVVLVAALKLPISTEFDSVQVTVVPEVSTLLSLAIFLQIYTKSMCRHCLHQICLVLYLLCFSGIYLHKASLNRLSLLHNIPIIFILGPRYMRFEICRRL